MRRERETMHYAALIKLTTEFHRFRDTAAPPSDEFFTVQTKHSGCHWAFRAEM